MQVRHELKEFAAAFKALKKALRWPQDLEVVARALTDEAVKTSAIEGVSVDESVVMSSICKALGVAYAPKGLREGRASRGRRPNDARRAAIVPAGLGGPETRYRLNISLCEPIDPLNEPIDGLDEGIAEFE